MSKTPKETQFLEHIYVSINKQLLFYHTKPKRFTVYPVSLSKNPPSCIENSFGTPLGMHEICEKIGEGEPIGTVFKARKSIGKTFNEIEDNNALITTRILRLKGLKEGLNSGINSSGQCCDTFKRCVYIHGTNKENLIGTRVSQGCINMKNQDMLELFNKVKLGTKINIADQ